MNSEWFLFKGSHHIGPFTSQEIELMFKKGEIVASVLIWREGSAKWEPIKNVSEFKYLFDLQVNIEQEKINKIGSNIEVPDLPPTILKELPPNLPKIPHEKDAPQVENLKTAKKLPQAPHRPTQVVPTFDSIPDDFPPPLPLDVLKSPPVNPVPEIKIKINGKKHFDFSKWFFYIFGLFVTIIFIWRFAIQPKSEIHFKIRDLMPINLEKLENTASALNPETNMSLALSMDGRKIYMSSNSEGEMDVNIKMVSVPGKILGNETATIFLRGKTFEHIGVFDKVILSNGKPFVPGHYKYSANVIEKHFVNAYFPVLSSINFFKNLNHKYILKGEEIIYAGSPKEFKEKLKKFNDEIFDQKTRPLQDKLERLNTIGALLDQLKAQFESILNKSKTGKEMKEFETYYMKEVAPVLQSIIVVDTDNSKNYNEFIKKVGTLAADEINKTIKLKKISASDKSSHLANFQKVRDAIFSELDLVKKQIQEEIKNTPR